MVATPAVQVAEAVLVEHYIAILPFKPKKWVMGHQLTTLEKALALMEAYASAKVGAYFIPKAWKAQVGNRPPYGIWDLVGGEAAWG